MKNFQWSDELSVNIEEIDHQHQELINFVNDLSQAMKIGRGEDKVAEILTRMNEYAIIHFATEERLMKLHGYPGLAEHKKEHDAFKNHVLRLNDGIDSGQGFLTEKVAHFLRNWITDHIQGTDMQYSSFLNGKGVC